MTADRTSHERPVNFFPVVRMSRDPVVLGFALRTISNEYRHWRKFHLAMAAKVTDVLTFSP